MRYLIIGIIIGIVLTLLLAPVYLERSLHAPVAYWENGYACYSVATILYGVQYVEYHEVCHELVYDDSEHFCEGYYEP